VLKCICRHTTVFIERHWTRIILWTQQPHGVYGIKFPNTKVIYYYQSLYDISGTGWMNVWTIFLWPVVEYTGRSFFLKTKLQVRMAGKNLVLLNLTLICVPCGIPYCVYTNTECLKFKTFDISNDPIYCIIHLELFQQPFDFSHFLSIYSEAYYSTWNIQK
jgi:hypothetical protein